MKKKTAFVLQAHELEQQKNRTKPFIKKDLTVGLTNHELGVFSTREKAEKMIADWLDHIKSWDMLILGFTLVEKIVDGAFRGQFHEISEFESVWAYDGNGKFLCDSLYDDACMIPFRGRETPVKQNVGDIAFVYCGNYAIPALVVDLPPSRDWWRSNIKNDFAGDCTDDSYTIIRWQYGHDHPKSTSVFPFVGIPPKNLEKRLWNEFKRYVADCRLSKTCIPTDRHHLKEDWAKK